MKTNHSSKRRPPQWRLRHLISIYLLTWVFLPAAAAQDTPIPTDTVFQVLQEEAEAAVKDLDRQRLKSIALQMQELAETHRRKDLRYWSLFYLGDAMMRENPIQAKSLIEEVLPYFEEKGDRVLIGRCYGLLGSIFTNINRSQEGIDLYKKAIEYFERSRQVDNQAQIQRRITAMYSNIGLAYSRLNFFDLAADYLFKAQEIAAQTTDTILNGAILNNLGNAFFLAGRTEDSREYYRRSYELGRQMGHGPTLRMGAVGLGNAFFESGRLDSSRFYFQQSVDLLRPGNNMVSLCIALSNLANVYGAMDQCRRADSISTEIIKIADEHQLDRYRALAYFNIAECAQHEGFYDKALDYATRSFDLIGGTGDLGFLQDIHETLHLAYLGKNDYEQALYHHKAYKAISDSILNEKSLNKIQELQARYENERKERQIEQLNEANRIQQLEYRQTLSWLVIGLIGISLAGAVYFFFNRQRILLANNQKLEAEQRLLRSQMNPHFIFNALSSIQTYLLSEGQAQKGAYYLTKFAKLIRRILEHSRVTFVPLADELETLEHYLALQQLRFDNGFAYQIDVDPHLHPEAILFPPMLLQPAVENAVEHGNLTRVPGGKVTVEVRQSTPQLLYIRIVDNGVGRQGARTTSADTGPHRSLATTIIRERIELLQKTYNQNVKYQIEDRPESGTIVTYVFPLNPKSIK